MRLYLIISLFVLSLPLCANENTTKQIEQRIQPVGEVHVQEEEKLKGNKDVRRLKQVKEDLGQKIYERYCGVCHRDGLVGAPKFRDEKDWKSRLSGKTIQDLVATALKGLNAMPMKGTCYECNEEDLKSAIEYMVPKS